MQIEEEIGKELADLVLQQIEKRVGPLRETNVRLEATNAILRGTVADLTNRVTRLETLLETKSLRVVHLRGSAA